MKDSKVNAYHVAGPGPREREQRQSGTGKSLVKPRCQISCAANHMQGDRTMRKVAFIMMAMVLSLCLPIHGEELPRLPFKLDTEYQYAFTFQGQPIGSQSFKVSQAERNQKRVFLLEEKLELVGKESKQRRTSTLILNKDLRPLEYQASFELDAPSMPMRSGKYEMSYKFLPGKVAVEIFKDGKLYQEMDAYTDKDIYCVANNHLSQFALLIARVFPLTKKETKVRVFHIDSTRTLDFKLEKGEKTHLVIDGRGHEAYQCRFWLDGVEIGYFFITPEGLLLRDVEKKGALIIQLQLVARKSGTGQE